jgi:hypothetical protein
MMSWSTWLDNRIRTICKKTCSPRGVKLESGDKPLPSTSPFVVPFQDPPLWHTGGYFNPASPTRVTVQPGSEGRYHVIAAVHWSFMFPQPFDENFRKSSCFVSWIERNGSTSTSPRDATAVDAPVVHGQVTTQLIVVETDLSANDFLELKVLWRDQGAGVPPSQIKLEAWLTVRRLCPAD